MPGVQIDLASIQERDANIKMKGNVPTDKNERKDWLESTKTVIEAEYSFTIFLSRRIKIDN